MSAPAPAPAADSGRPRLSGEFNPWLNLSGFSALLGWSIRRLLRGPRVLGVAVLFLLPTLIVLLGRANGAVDSPSGIEFYLLFILIPTAFIPFAALIFSSGLIQDEVEEQTLTYLLIRPMPRAAIYTVKIIAAIVVTALIATACTAVNEAVIYASEPPPSGNVPSRVLSLVGLYALVLVAYNALFGFIGLIFKKSLPVGVIYIVLFEGFLSTIPLVFRKLTVVYYFRAMALRWFGGEETLAKTMRETWAITESMVPGSAECLATLLAAALALLLASCGIFTARELRVKTPETT